MKKDKINSQIKLLKWMLEDIRKVTIEGVNHLTKEQLFMPPIVSEYPIGAYLMHFAECDIGWLEVISGIKPSNDLKQRAYYSKWFDCGPDYNPPEKPVEKKEYFDVMKSTRKLFLDYISTLDDSDLDDIIIRKRNNIEKRYSKKWIIYHILEHEAHTRGQIFMLIRKAGWNKK